MKNLIYIIIGLLVWSACSDDDEQQRQAQLLDRAQLSEILRPDALRPNPFDTALDSMPPKGKSMKINYLGATLGKVFNDSNYKHKWAASKIGIVPFESVSDIWTSSVPLVKVESNEYVFVDELTHSEPFLVPKAAKLLNDIGRNFRDSLNSRGGGAYRIKATSVLRTDNSINRLRRINANAIEGSTHLYGTTFDISYSKFICDHDSLPRTQEDLKNLLGEVLYKLRADGRCYVKYERRQACFHITAR